MQRDAACPAVTVHAHSPCDGIYPRQDWLTRAVRAPHAMYTQPRFLQQVVSLFPVRHLAPEESKQGGAKSANQSGRRVRIGLLVALHPAIQVCKVLPRYDILFETGLQLWIIRSSNPPSYALREHFFGNSRQLGHPICILLPALNIPDSRQFAFWSRFGTTLYPGKWLRVACQGARHRRN